MESSSELPFFNKKITRPIMRTSVLFGACDDVRAQKLVICLSAVLHVVQQSNVDIQIYIIVYFRTYFSK